jgi:RNA recognition motif-containing protein
MHLFVGNLSKNVKLAELEAEFSKYGPCKVKIPKVPIPSYKSYPS